MLKTLDFTAQSSTVVYTGAMGPLTLKFDIKSSGANGDWSVVSGIGNHVNVTGKGTWGKNIRVPYSRGALDDRHVRRPPSRAGSSSLRRVAVDLAAPSKRRCD